MKETDKSEASHSVASNTWRLPQGIELHLKVIRSHERRVLVASVASSSTVSTAIRVEVAPDHVVPLQLGLQAIERFEGPLKMFGGEGLTKALTTVWLPALRWLRGQLVENVHADDADAYVSWLKSQLTQKK